MSPDRILLAKNFYAKINQITNLFPIRDQLKDRVAATCFSIAMDHQAAIIILLEKNFNSSAFSLLRIMFDAYIRGIWIANCAKNDQIEKYWHSGTKKTSDALIAEIEASEPFSCGSLAAIKNTYWPRMCDYIHTSGLHIQMWQSADAIEPKFTASKLEECLSLAEIFGALAGHALIQLDKNGNDGSEVLALMLKRWPLNSN